MSTILVIEDDMEVRVLIQSLLERQGHEVFLAEDGIQAMEAFASSTPDVVITDLLMPRQDGIETIKEIRDIDAEMKILAISGGGTGSLETLLKQAKSAGATETLKKPFIPSDLFSFVNRFI